MAVAALPRVTALRITRQVLRQRGAGKRRRRRCTRQERCWARGWLTLARPPPNRPSGRCHIKVGPASCLSFSLSLSLSFCIYAVKKHHDPTKLFGLLSTLSRFFFLLFFRTFSLWRTLRPFETADRVREMYIYVCVCVCVCVCI